MGVNGPLNTNKLDWVLYKPYNAGTAAASGFQLLFSLKYGDKSQLHSL